MAENQFYKIENIKDVDLRALLALLRRRAPGFNFLEQFTTEAKYIRAILRSWSSLKDFEIDTPRRIAHFLGQGIVETGYFKSTEESFKYSLDALMKFHGSDFRDRAEARSYIGNEERIANRVYAHQNGNGGEESGDGYRYRGRGFIQLTGRANYRKFGLITDLPLEEKPDILTKDLRNSIRVAAAFCHENGILRYADDNNSAAVSRAINRGRPDHPKPAYHEVERRQWTNSVLQLFDDPERILKGTSDVAEGGALTIGSRGGDVKSLQGFLTELGYEVGPLDGIFGRGTERAVYTFQREYGLEESGVVDASMIDLLEEAVKERRGPDRPGAGISDMRRAGARDPGETRGQATGAVVAGASGTAIAAETGVIESARDVLTTDGTDAEDSAEAATSEQTADGEINLNEDDSDQEVSADDSGVEDKGDEDVLGQLSSDAEEGAEEEPNAFDESDTPEETPDEQVLAPEDSLVDGEKEDLQTEDDEETPGAELPVGGEMEDMDVGVPEPEVQNEEAEAVAGPNSDSDLPSTLSEEQVDPADEDLGQVGVQPEIDSVEAPITDNEDGTPEEIPDTEQEPDEALSEVDPVDVEQGKDADVTQEEEDFLEDLPADESVKEEVNDPAVIENIEADPSSCVCPALEIEDEVAPTQMAESSEMTGVAALPPRDTENDTWNYTAISAETAGVAIGAFLMQRARARAKRRLEEYRNYGRLK